MEQMVTLISEHGFLIVVTLFLLNRIEAKLDVVVVDPGIAGSAEGIRKSENRLFSLIRDKSLKKTYY